MEILQPMNPALLRMQEQALRIREKMDKVKHKIAVVSGKGGVGKTTVAVHIAALLARTHKVGLLDADVDCPNVGKMLDINAHFKPSDGKLLPIEAHNMKIASMAFLPQDEGQPAIWRGPIIHTAILQLIELVDWGALDYIIFDMPPGTSDAALTVMQNVTPDFFVVVTTPSTLALLDAEKSANMVKQFGRRFGIVENMSGDFFGKGGGERLAKKMKVPFLGRVTLSKEISKACEQGKLALYDAQVEKEFYVVVDAVKKNLG